MDCMKQSLRKYLIITTLLLLKASFWGLLELIPWNLSKFGASIIKNIILSFKVKVVSKAVSSAV